MQLVSARIWTRVAVSISYDGNHYTTVTSSEQHLVSIADEAGTHLISDFLHELQRRDTPALADL